MTLIETATSVLTAMATSDLAAVRALSRPDVIVYGTDADERWSGLEPLCEALDAMRALRLSATWLSPPSTAPGWVAGLAEYSGPDIGPLLVRVTMVFDDTARLAHAHFSVESDAPAA